MKKKLKCSNKFAFIKFAFISKFFVYLYFCNYARIANSYVYRNARPQVNILAKKNEIKYHHEFTNIFGKNKSFRSVMFKPRNN